jgi:hypothetical protein
MSSVVNWICWTPPPKQNSWVRHWLEMFGGGGRVLLEMKFQYFHQHCNVTAALNPITVLMNCSKFKAVTDVYVTDLNTNVCDQNKLMPNIFLSHLQLLNMNISFVSMTCISHCQICFNKDCFSCFKCILYSHGHTFIQQKDMWLCKGKNSMIYWFYTSKDIRVRVMKFMLHICCS